MVHLDNQLRRASANIVEPSGTSDNSLKFMAGLTVAVTLVADIDEVENIQDVRIKVRFIVIQFLVVLLLLFIFSVRPA